jgi:ATP-binding cassette, subfamily B, bacterial PglK
VRRYLREILDLLGGERRRLPGLVVLFVGSSLLDFIGIGLVGAYVALIAVPGTLEGRLGDVLQALSLPRGREAALIAVGVFLVAIFLLKAAVAIWIHRVTMRFSQQQQVRLRSVLMQAYQHLPYTEFLRRNSSEYVYAIQDLTADFAYVIQIGLRTVGDGIMALVVLALLAWQNASALALLAALILAMVYGYDRLFRQNLRSYGERVNRAATEVVQGIQEGMEGLKEIRILGKEGYFHRKVREGAGEYARLQTRAQVIAAAPRYLLELTMVAFVVGLVLLHLLLGRDLEALVPTLGIFGVAALRLLPAANALSSNLVQMRYRRNSIAQLHGDLAVLGHVRFEPASTAEAARPEPFRGLVVDRIRFTYPNAAVAALDGVSLEIRADESIGLVGPSGSGKTTLVDVLLGLLEPQQGQLRYNGRPLKEALVEWRAQVAYLPQQVFLIDASLRRNVALGLEDREIDEPRLREALRQARLVELVAQLPEGVDTIVGEHGVRLSGGQRQRVAIARAFYHGRDVLVMDEATSALDNETEREIVEEIRQLKGQKTLIVIAHRLTTVQHCDRIFRLKEGRIVEQGTYREVFRPDEPAPGEAVA